MSQLEFISILQQTLILILQLATPVLATSVIVGLMISIFQSITQIQESTLTFVPKIVAGIVVFIITLPWMLGVFVNTVNELFAKIPSIIH
ncbi:MAG: flagellar biosynthetic protein FliQ [Candidatus Gastranaerophilales bacterium]|nr:flagellar biosynthetic protein FliQ [Candidatus Gastranaerophilales bacterium]